MNFEPNLALEISAKVNNAKAVAKQIDKDELEEST